MQGRWQTSFWLWALVVVFGGVRAAETSTSNATTLTPTESTPINLDFLNMLRNESRYNRHATPSQYLGYPTNVSISMYIEGMSSFSAQNMAFHVDMYLYQEWKDPRLRHTSGTRMLIRDRQIFALMWHPDVYFANARTAKFQEVTADNFLIWIRNDGLVFYDCRISMSVMCMMELSKYPLDGQQCSLRVLSYAYDETQLVLQWSDSIVKVDKNPGIRMPDMVLLNITTGSCDGTYSTGVWSCKTATFVVQREILHHILQTYLPTALIVVISWLSFWLDVDSAPARVSLSITTLLTISTQANAVKLSLPEVSYMKAIDVWMGTCMTFVFGVMIEFTVCHFARTRVMEDSPAKKKASIMHRKASADSSGTTAVGPSVVNGASALGGIVFASTLTAPPSRKASRATSAQQYQAQVVMEGDESSANANLLHPEEIIEYMRVGERKQNALGPRSPVARHFSGGGLGEKRQPRTMRSNSMIAARLLHPRALSTRAEKWSSALRQMQGRKAAASIDEKCRYLFPTAFFVFNCVYWFYYLVYSR